MNKTRKPLRIFGILMIGAAALALFYGGISYFALRSGNEKRAARIEIEIREEMERQLELAQADIVAGNYSLAILRLDAILENAAPAATPYYGQASQLKAEAQHLDAIKLTPTLTPIPATATPIPPITPTPEPVAALQQLEELVAAESWAEAIPAIMSYQSENPNYQRQETNKLLFDSLASYGTHLLSGEKVELGMSYLRQAELLGPLPQETQDQMAWADLYVRGISFFGVEWPAAISYFSELCLAAPFYQESCAKLYEARVTYAEQLAANLDWCPAEIYFMEAWQQEGENEVNQERIEASQKCRQATPTPTITPTATPDSS